MTTSNPRRPFSLQDAYGQPSPTPTPAQPAGVPATPPGTTGPFSIGQAFAPIPSPTMPSVTGALSLVGEGMQQGVADLVGALPAAAAYGTNAIGLTDVDPGVYSQAVKDALEWIGDQGARLYGGQPVANRPTPRGHIEEAFYGGGEAAGLSIPFVGSLGPLSRLLGAAGRPASAAVVNRMAAAPALQVGAETAGGAVGGYTDNPYLGMLTSLLVGAAPGVVPRAVTPFPRTGPRVPASLQGQAGDQVQAALDQGYDLTAAQITQSRPLRNLEAALAELPFGGGAVDDIVRAQRQQFLTEALGQAGIQADQLTPEVLGTAARRLGNEADQLAARTTLIVDDQLRRELDGISAQYVDFLDDANRTVAERVINEIVQSGADRAITGTDFQQWHSRISELARGAPNGWVRNTLLAVNRALDDAVDRSVADDPALLEDWRGWRQQWRNLMVLENTYRGGRQGDRLVGDLSLGSFQRAVRSADPRGYTRGGTPFDQQLGIGDLLASSAVPNSGTAQRLSYTNMLTGGALGTGALGAYGGLDAADVAKMVGGVFALPGAMGRMINSQAVRNYLANQRLVGAGPWPVTPELLGSLQTQQMIGN